MKTALRRILGPLLAIATMGLAAAALPADAKMKIEGKYATVNGVKANGGSMSNAGATVVGGMLFVHSGYSHHGAIIPGNVLLAFAPE